MYEYLDDFHKNEPAVWEYARYHFWLDDYIWLKRKNIIKYKRKQGTHRKPITYNDCLDAARQCHSRYEFRERFGYLYLKSLEKKWIEKFLWLPKETIYKKNI